MENTFLPTLTHEDLHPDSILPTVSGWTHNGVRSFSQWFKIGTAEWLMAHEPSYLFRISTNPLTYAYPEKMTIFIIYWSINPRYGGEGGERYETTSVYQKSSLKTYLMECSIWLSGRGIMQVDHESRISQLYWYLEGCRSEGGPQSFYGEDIEGETLRHHLTKVSPRSDPIPLRALPCFEPYLGVTIGEMINEELIKELV